MGKDWFSRKSPPSLALEPPASGAERGGLRAMARSSLFDGLPPLDLENIPLLLDRLNGRLGADIDRLEVQIKGRLSDQEGRLRNLEGRVGQQENCPCQVHRDPGHKCPILVIMDRLNIMQRRLAWYAGIFAAATAMLYALPNLLWLLKRGF